jgi:isovaleryl-CoA dehydrogenase
MPSPAPAMPADATRFDAAGAILLASENAVKVSLEAIQALGGAGYTKDWPVERFLRDAKLLDIGAGTNEIRRYLIGRDDGWRSPA